MSRLSKNDPSSYAQPENLVTRHVDLFWNVDFASETISGEAHLQFETVAKEIEQILLDVSDLTIDDVSVQTEGGKIPVNFFVSDYVKEIGSKLTVELPTSTSDDLKVIIEYKTSPKASGLQWLTPENTLGKVHPYVYSQCQAIHARSIVPCQDTPQVKFTFRAEVTHPPELTALLGGVRVSSENGKTIYEQTTPIPAYLLAIAVGAIVSRPLGKISKVWAEEGIVDECAEEFSETSQMLAIAEEICGPYVWKEYDLLVMPPSFPFGGMENPCLTFITPTLLAGDKSLATVVAHEISHSWTGNLVTNANWEHFWLNEGFTMFLEGKIAGRMFGNPARDFHAIQGLSELQDCLQGQLAKTPEMTKLVPDITGLNPDDTYSSVPYIKGQNFLRYLEDLFGGPSVFEPFFRFYLEKYKYKSLVSDEFKATVYEYFNGKADDKLAQVDWDLWLNGEGMPPIIPNYDQTYSKTVDQQAEIWNNNTVENIKKHPDINGNLHIWELIELLTVLVQNPNNVEITEDWINLLEETYGLVGTRNSANLFSLSRLYVKGRLFHRIDKVFAFLNSNFRMKYVRPIYRDLNKWPEAKPLAVENFLKVKNQMMKCCSLGVAKDLEIEVDL